MPNFIYYCFIVFYINYRMCLSCIVSLQPLYENEHPHPDGVGTPRRGGGTNRFFIIFTITKNFRVWIL